MNKLLPAVVAAAVIAVSAPLAIAVAVTTIGAAAALEQLRTIDCAGPYPATGAWRPPFTQPYTVSARGFGMQFHPIHQTWSLHNGQDLVSRPGPGPVVAIGDGTVVFAGAVGGYGNVVDISHPQPANTTTDTAGDQVSSGVGRGASVLSRYAHLASLDVTTGTHVVAGQALGVEGSTGSSTGNHLHLEIHVDGVPVDPVPWMAEHGAPLDGRTVAVWEPPDEPVEEGGVGFPLPPPSAPRKDSLHNPPRDIPPAVKKLYMAAGQRYRIPWTLLAGIGMEETAHGANTATSSAGARGLMQFMPATWAVMGVDGDGDGHADITNDADSVASAANYLARSGVTRGPAGVRRALLAYNHADWYVGDVLYYAHAYGAGTVLGAATSCPPGNGNPALPPITQPRLRAMLTWATSHDGDQYVMGATGPSAWDCSSFTQAALAHIGITAPRTAQAQRDWLAAGNGYRVDPAAARPGDLLFYDSYLGPTTIGHVALILDPTQQSTIEAMNTARGVTTGSYAGAAPRHTIFEVWRVGNITDRPT